MKKILLPLMLILITSFIFASTMQIGIGTNIQRYPLGSYYGYERSAAIYKDSELGAQNIRITALSWYSTAAVTVNVPTKIYVKTTTETTLTKTTWANMISGATLVYDATHSSTLAGGWNQFDLSTFFDVPDGNGLIVMVERNYGGTGNGTSAGAGIRYTSVNNTHEYWQADNNPPTGDGTRNKQRPNILIHYILPPPNPATIVSPANGAINVELTQTLNWANGGGAPSGYKLSLGTVTPYTTILNQVNLGTATTYDPDLVYNTQYWWQVIPYNEGGDASNCPVWYFTTKPDPVISSFPYAEGFEVGNTNNTAIYGWTQASVSGSNEWTANNSLTDYNRSPRTGSWNAFLRWGNSRWMFKPIQLQAGIAYRAIVYARQDGATASDASIKICYGASASAAGMTNEILPSTGIVNGDYQRLEGTFTPSSTGLYYLGILGTINNRPWYISIDDITIEEVPQIPVCSVNPEFWDFGELIMGLTSSKVFTITNTGGATLYINNVYTTNSSYSILQQPGDCELSFNESTTFTVLFNPLEGGTQTGNVVICYNGGEKTIALTGSCIDTTINSFPYTQSFENGGENWLVSAGVGATYYWELVRNDAAHGAVSAYDGSYFARLNVYSAHYDYNPYCLISPPLNLSSGNKRLNYWVWIGANGYPAPLDVQISTDNQATWTTLFSHDLSVTNTWFNNIISLSSYSTSHIFIRFKATSNYGNGYCNLGLDKITIEDVPPTPIMSYTPGEIIFPYTNVKSVTDYINVTITNIGGGILSLSESSFTLQGSNPNDFEINNFNLPANLGTGQSVNIPVRFKPVAEGNRTAILRIDDGLRSGYDVSLTGYAAGQYVLCENFEGTFPAEDWTSPSTSWIRNSDFSHTGTASALAGYTAGTYWLVTPKLRPIEGANTLTFWYRDYSSDTSWDYNNEYTYVLVSKSTDFSPATTLWTGNYQTFTTSWQQASISLSDYNGKDIYIAFKHIATGGNYRMIDDITGVHLSFSTVPNPAVIVSPANEAVDVSLTQTLNWTSGGGSPRGYYLSFGSVIPPLIYLDNVDMGIITSYTPNLDINKRYWWKVVPYNEAGNAENCPIWTFTTMEDPTIRTFPYTEDFEGETFLPLGWTKIVHNGNDITKDATKNHSNPGQYSVRFSSYNLSDNYNQYLFTAPIFVRAPYTKLTFWHIKENASDETLEWGIATNPNPSSFTWNPVNLSSSEWQRTEINLRSYMGHKIYIGFHYYGNYSYYVYLDDINIKATIPANVPTPIADIVINSTIDLDLDESVDETNPIVQSLPNITALNNPVVLGLIGAETANMTFEVGPGTWYGICYYGGEWHHSIPYPCTVAEGATGTITFENVDFGAKGEVIAVMNEGQNPTLPVELSAFTVNLNPQSGINIMWVTQSETGVNGYYIYRANVDTLSLASLISPLIRASNTSQQQVYLYTDKEIYESGIYYYWLETQDIDGVSIFYGSLSIDYKGNNNGTPEIPLVTGIRSIYPNPFNPSTTINYELSKTAEVKIEIYNIRGQLVRSYALGKKERGRYKLLWEGDDNNRRSCGTGMYFIRMQADKENFIKKVTLLK